jgi:antitoxin (DNA-binding transcriptional repressor) of toxin-antitoxin stability system
MCGSFRLCKGIVGVGAGRSVTITYHGEPVAELRPIAAADTAESRIERLEERGLVSARPAERAELAPIIRRPGALRRFLAERDEA